MAYKQEFDNYWDAVFPGGEQTIYIVGGNMDSSDAQTTLCIMDELERKFKNWREVGEHILEHKDNL